MALLTIPDFHSQVNARTEELRNATRTRFYMHYLYSCGCFWYETANQMRTNGIGGMPIRQKEFRNYVLDK